MPHTMQRERRAAKAAVERAAAELAAAQGKEAVATKPAGACSRMYQSLRLMRRRLAASGNKAAAARGAAQHSSDSTRRRGSRGARGGRHTGRARAEGWWA